MSDWLCLIGYVSLAMSHWLCLIGYVRLAMSDWQDLTHMSDWQDPTDLRLNIKKAQVKVAQVNSTREIAIDSTSEIAHMSARKRYRRRRRYLYTPQRLGTGILHTSTTLPTLPTLPTLGTLPTSRALRTLGTLGTLSTLDR